MKKLDIKNILHKHCAFLPTSDNRTWLEVALKAEAPDARAKQIVTGCISNDIYAILQYRGKRWLSFYEGGEIEHSFRIEQLRLEAIVGESTEEREILKRAKKLIKAKGTHFSWELARRISNIILHYPVSNRRRQNLASLAISLRTHTKIR